VSDSNAESPALVFISYSHKNARAAGALKEQLEESHYSCFLAHDDVPGADDWHEEIWKTLHTSYAFVGLVTDEFNSSAFCQQEIGAALALGKPSLLILVGAQKTPGFAARFQAIKPDKLLRSLNGSPKFRQLRAEAWIGATRKADSFANANAVYSQFREEWQTMTEDEKLRWLLAAAGNGQVLREGYHVGPFYQRVFKELKPQLTNQWLFDNDKEGRLHDFESNPIGLKKQKKKKKTK
jgi:hypothetical protein